MNPTATNHGPLSAALDRAVADVRELKENWVREAHSPTRGATDISPLVQGWRGSEPVVLMTPTEIARDDALYAARFAAVAFGCDILAFTVEGWQPTDPERNPATGRPWGPGELERAVEDEGALEAGWVTEALTTHVVNRAGDVLGALLPYRVDRRMSSLGITSYNLEWGPQPDLPQDATWGGYVIDSLVQYMQEPPMDVVMAKAGMPPARAFGLNAEEARAHIDCAIMKVLRHSFDGSVMLLADSEARASVIEHSLAGYGS